MSNLDHIMPKPFVIPVLWGHDYAENPNTVQNIQNMVSDLVTGPFMNGMAQYGVRRGSVHEPIVIDDQDPPATITYSDSNNKLVDQITKKLIGWIDAGLVPPPSSNSDINQMYLIIPPSETTPQIYNGASDPIGNGVQGWHNEGVTNPGPPPTYYWAIVKTNFVNGWNGGPISSLNFVAEGIAPLVGHELAEQFVDYNGSYKEIGDPCIDNTFQYRGWTVQQYYSVWDGNICINGDNPVSLTKFLTTIGFDHKNKGLRSLGAATINIDYIALKMQSFETVAGS
jgi:hypothetical protein